MSRYHLSEAYASIYNPRLQEDFDDNLRFIDYMLDEDIEEVVESLFWEFRDYGHSIDESIDLLRASANDEILCESMDYLAEANPYAPAGSKESQQYNKFANKAKSDWEKPWRDAQRRATRKARIDGAISRVKSAWKGATGGLGRAAKAVRSGVSKAGEFVSQQREAGKAKLQKLMRTGSQKVGQAVRKGSATIERTKRNITGETARAKESRQRVSRLSGQQSRSAEARKDPWSGSYSSAPSNTRTTSSTKALPASKSQAALPPAKQNKEAPSNPRREKALARRKRDSELPTAKGRRFAGPAGSGVGAASKRSNTGYAAAAQRFAKKAGIEENLAYELLDTIIEDLIYEGYANNIDEALNIINTLNEDTLQDITQEYLFG